VLTFFGGKIMTDRPDPLAEPEGYGRRAAPALRQPAHVHQRQCVMIMVDQTGQRQCLLPAAWCVKLGDAQEHLADLDYCETHAFMAERAVVPATCTACTGTGIAGVSNAMRFLRKEPLAIRNPLASGNDERVDRAVDWAFSRPGEKITREDDHDDDTGSGPPAAG
jgi:hypothetical protein